METKQVIVMRKLNIRKGKMVSQGGHAASAFLLENYGRSLTEEEYIWVNNDYPKICVVVKTEEELLYIYNKSRMAGLTTHLITDSGRTEFDGIPTNTCVAIGPHEVSKIDVITGHLPLL